MKKTYNVTITNFFTINSSDMLFIFELCPDYCGQSGNGSFFCFLGFKTKREAELFVSSVSFFCHTIRNYNNVLVSID